MRLTSAPLAPAQITGVILCGGNATRLGGVQKALLLHRGRPLLSWIMEALTGELKALVISANRELEHYATFGAEIVTDSLTDAGPLAGIVASMDHVCTPWLFVCPGDMPHITGQVVRRLALHAEGEQAVYASDGARDHYLCALLRGDCRPQLLAYLDSGQRSVRGFLRDIGALRVSMPDLTACFINVNDGAALSSLQRTD